MSICKKKIIFFYFSIDKFKQRYYNSHCRKTLPGYNTCRCGGTGRRTGLKILRWLNTVPVRFRPSAPRKRLSLDNLFYFASLKIM